MKSNTFGIPALWSSLLMFFACPSFALPELFGFRTTVYVGGISKPGQLAFGSDGTLFVGNGNDTGRLRCVPPGGGTFFETGDAVADPDPVAVDVSGRLLGSPGYLLTGGDIGAGRGTIWRVTTCGILPSETLGVVGPSTDIGNCGPFHWHPTKGLMFVRTSDASGAITAIEKNSDSVLSLRAVSRLDPEFSTSGWLSVARDGTIVKASNSGRTLRLFTATGEQLRDLDVGKLELGPYPGVAFGDGYGNGLDSLLVLSVVSGDLYVIDSSNGSGTRIGTGFEDVVDVEFGPDSSMYLSDSRNDRIIRVVGNMVENGDFELPAWTPRYYDSRRNATASTGDDTFVFLPTTLNKSNESQRGYNAAWVELPGGSTYIDGWKVGGAGVYHHLDNRPWWVFASSGDSCIQMNRWFATDDVRGGLVEQAITGLVPGVRHYLSVDIRQDSLSPAAAVIATVSGVLTNALLNSARNVWQTHTLSFLPYNRYATLSIGTPEQTVPSTFIDRVRIGTNRNLGVRVSAKAMTGILVEGRQGSAYRVEWSRTLDAGPWNLLTRIVLTNGPAWVHDEVGYPDGRRFYRTAEEE